MRFLNLSELRRISSSIDVVIEVVDSRVPLITRSIKLERLAEKYGISIVLTLNKIDLIPRYVVEKWLMYFREKEGMQAVAVSAAKNFGLNDLIKALESSSTKRPIVAVIAGMPKVGKSSIINSLKKYEAAPTSPYPGAPGYTKGVQLYKVRPNIYIIDTPGVVPPPKSPEIEYVIRRSPIEKIPEPVSIAIEIIRRVLNLYPNVFTTIYGVATSDPLRVLEGIATRRGLIYKRTREPNIDEAARIVIRDYLNGKIPYYTLPPEE